MTSDSAQAHASFARAVRGAVVAMARFSPGHSREAGWPEVQAAWSGPRHDGRPTPWDALRAKQGRAINAWHRSDLSASRRPSKPDGFGSLRGPVIEDGLLRPIVFADSEGYYYEVPPGVDTPLQVRTGPLIWAYDGQQVFRPEGIPQPSSEEAEHSGPRSLDEDVGTTVRLDRWGRRWLLVGYDADLVDQKVVRYNETVRAKVRRRA